jgi:CelD/BcsL family acetyltransferase involved in cellulose biosynthesis
MSQVAAPSPSFGESTSGGLDVKVFPGRVLPADLISRWAAVQERSQAFRSPFYRPEYTGAVASVRGDVLVAEIGSGGEVIGYLPFQRSRFGFGRTVGGGRTNYDGPLIDPGWAWDARELVGKCGLRGYSFRRVPAEVAPLRGYASSGLRASVIDLGGGFEQYRLAKRAAGSKVVGETERQGRRMERGVGELTFEPRSLEPEPLRLLMRWKSQQWVRTGEFDRFSIPWVVELLERLHGCEAPGFASQVSVLRAGDRIAAVSYSLRSHAHWHGWFQAYDQELATYSPGMILMLRLFEAAAGQGATSFDLGTGEAAFKVRFRTRIVDVGSGEVVASQASALLAGVQRRCSAAALRAPIPARLRQATLMTRVRMGGAPHL